MTIIHASCVAFGSRGVLIRGPSGSGKSSLALRLVDEQGFGLGKTMLRGKLVCDDQTEVTLKGKTLWASAPSPLKGLIELRGLGIMALSHIKNVRLHLAVDLVPHAKIPRLREPQDLMTLIEGVPLPRIMLDAHLPQAAALVRAALSSDGILT